MGTFELSGADGTYIIKLVDFEAAPIIKDENRNGHVKGIGAMGTFEHEHAHCLP